MRKFNSLFGKHNLMATSNGRTGGITHPDADGQERAIRRAYQRAGDLDPGLTSFFECHGTGTPVGDPIEVEAVGRVFAAGRNAERPLYIGSVKSNMGHCEAASGIAGIMKTVLAIENSIIPPLRGLNSINPNGEFDPVFNIVSVKFITQSIYTRVDSILYEKASGGLSVRSVGLASIRLVMVVAMLTPSSKKQTIWPPVMAQREQDLHRLI